MVFKFDFTLFKAIALPKCYYKCTKITLVVNLGRPTVYTRRETFAHVVFSLLFF